MIDLIPDSKQLSEIFAQAIAPTFFLGAIAGAPLLFLFATFFIGFALLRFAQEARISLTEADEYL